MPSTAELSGSPSSLSELIDNLKLYPREPKYSVMTGSGVPIFLWNKDVSIEDAAIQQLKNLAQMKFVHHHVAAMPDTHFGIGATVGSVFASTDAVIPAAVGVDIGCGMIAAKTNLNAHDLVYSGHVVFITRDDLLKQLRAEIERRVPMGRTSNGGPGDRGAWGITPPQVQAHWDGTLAQAFAEIVYKHPELAKGNAQNHLGTLGTGNHFIEIQLDEAQRVWVMLHSGSRGVGNRIGQYFIKQAKALMERYHIQLPDKDLAFLPKDNVLYGDYLKALNWAQTFAYQNREIMLYNTLAAMNTVLGDGVQFEEIINTHHNYAEFENHFGKNVLLTRKGAIRARLGDAGIIPGSMGTRSYIVRGLGNPLSFHSCSHGAGRAMSRTEAKKRFTLDDHAAATAGVECRKDLEVIDETPAAYKSIDAVIAAESDLVDVVHTLKQILCCKG